MRAPGGYRDWIKGAGVTAQNPPGAVLVVHRGVAEPGAIELDGARHTLGKEPNADVSFDNVYVSRRHAEIAFSRDAYTIRDLGSKNGTFVDGHRVGTEPRELGGGEVIELGRGQVVVGFRVGSRTVTLAASSSSRSDASAPADQTDTVSLSDPSRDRSLFVDAAHRRVFVDGELLSPPLSRRQFDVLALLWEQGGEACHQRDLAAMGWPERLSDDVTDREISQCVYRLRKRIEREPEAPPLIISIRGFGYRLSEQVWAT